jgi:REP element-mobilizing transposase RayT
VAKKWSNTNLPGALHFVTGNTLDRARIFTDASCCTSFLEELRDLNQKWPSKLIAYVLMPDHFHLITNPRDGRIKEFIGALKSFSAKRIVKTSRRFRFHADTDGYKVWQQSFKAIPLWSGWMIWQKINYIHANPVKASLVKSAKDYAWSSFRSFYSQGETSLAVDHDWWWQDDAEKLSRAVKEIGLCA